MLKKTKRRTVIFGLLALALICFIFFNSAQTGEESSISSGFVTDIVKRLLGVFGITVQEESLSFFIRKAAHFSEYFLLSLAASLFVLSEFSKKKYIALSSLLAFSVAVCDEFIVQSSTLGRSPEWCDVLIDTCGALTAVLLLALFLFLRAKRLCKKEKTK